MPSDLRICIIFVLKFLSFLLNFLSSYSTLFDLTHFIPVLRRMNCLVPLTFVSGALSCTCPVHYVCLGFIITRLAYRFLTYYFYNFSSVNIVAKLHGGRQGYGGSTPGRCSDFYVLCSVRRSSGAHRLHIHWALRIISLGIKRPGHDSGL
jgi:hypothetical protein